MVVSSLKWLGKIVGIVLVSAILSIWVAGFIVTSVVESVLKQYEIPLTIEPVAFSGVWGALWGYEQQSSSLADLDLNIEHEVEHEESLDAKLNIGNNEDALNTENAAGDDNYNGENAIDALAPIETGEEIAMTTEQFDEVKSNLEEEDKNRIFEILMTEVPSDSWQMFSTYLEDGLTDKELLEVQQVMAQHLSSEQYDELMSILKKY